MLPYGLEHHAGMNAHHVLKNTRDETNEHHTQTLPKRDASLLQSGT